ncbi:MAG: NAD(P)-binding domain-containing protein [Gemmatimonadales bacterium]
MKTPLLIIGAGPFGLAAAAAARHARVEYLIVGIPMSFWHAHMPDGMILRSDCDWHLDPDNIHTIEAFLQTRHQVPADVEPLSIEFYREYASWFQREKKIEVTPASVLRLDQASADGYRYVARLEDGGSIAARNVLVAVGFEYFKKLPNELIALLPAGRFSHTCDLVDFSGLAGRSCLIVGGRQSAFEWAALIAEKGASNVHVCHRHESPSLEASDWSWVAAMLDEIERNPGWLRNMSAEERRELDRRFWQEGRLRLEPWLKPRVERASISLWPNRQVVASHGSSDGRLVVSLDSGDALTVDHVVLATGYEVDVGRVPFLADGNLLHEMKTTDGNPVLDESLQSSLPGLYLTSMMATRDFGPFFAFTVAARAAARIAMGAIARSS